ncbi:MAG: hypothetical protein ACQEUO_18275 [Bacillota bacterium]
MTTLYTLPRHFNTKDFYVQPVTEVLEDAVQVTTWKYDNDQSLFNFEVKFSLEFVAKNGIHYEEKNFFLNNYQDQISEITDVVVRDGYLIIGGLKDKGNENKSQFKSTTEKRIETIQKQIDELEFGCSVFKSSSYICLEVLREKKKELENKMIDLKKPVYLAEESE